MEALLLKLTPEVMMTIISMLDHHVLPQPLLACKGHCSISTNHFFRAYLGVRSCIFSCIFSRQSLQDLIELTTNPLDRYLRHISMGTHYIEDPRDCPPEYAAYANEMVGFIAGVSTYECYRKHQVI